MGSMRYSMLLVLALFVQTSTISGITENEFRSLERKMELRMNVFEIRDTDQHNTILQQQETLRLHESVIADMRQALQRQSEIVDTLTNLVNSQGLTIKRQSGKIALLEKHYRRSHTKATPVSKKQIEDMERVVVSEHTGIIGETEIPMSKRFVVSDGESPVAFMISTTDKEIDNLGVNQIIIFDKVVLNLGNGYDANHGIFTAPVSGIYLISVSLLIDNDSNTQAYASIVLNGVGMAHMYSDIQNDGVWGHSTHTIVIQVNKGEEISVINDGNNGKVYGYGFSSFSGYLLTSMPLP